MALLNVDAPDETQFGDSIFASQNEKFFESKSPFTDNIIFNTSCRFSLSRNRRDRLQYHTIVIRACSDMVHNSDGPPLSINASRRSLPSHYITQYAPPPALST